MKEPVYYSKACSCKSDSTSGGIQIFASPSGRTVSVSALFHPQPTCNRCGTPWTRPEEKSA